MMWIADFFLLCAAIVLHLYDIAEQHDDWE
jgi:hypothetical protein